MKAGVGTTSSGALGIGARPRSARSEEHTSELQSQSNLVCRLLLEKKNESNLQSFIASMTQKLTLSDISVFFFNDTATTEIYTLSLHDALPIWAGAVVGGEGNQRPHEGRRGHDVERGVGDRREAALRHEVARPHHLASIRFHQPGGGGVVAAQPLCDVLPALAAVEPGRAAPQIGLDLLLQMKPIAP